MVRATTRLAPGVFALALLLAAPARADTARVQWVDGSFAEALERAKAEEKPLMVDVYASWCGPCHLLDRKVYTDPTVIKASEDWIAVKLDGELGEGVELVKRYHVVGYPTVLFLDSSGEEIDRIFGFEEAPAFAATMIAYLAGKQTLLADAAAALEDPTDLAAALDVGTRFAVKGDARNAYRHFARILEARQRLLDRKARTAKVGQRLLGLTGDRAARSVGKLLAADLASAEDRQVITGMSAQVYLVLGKFLFLRGKKDNRRALQILEALVRTFPETEQAREAPYHIAVALQRLRRAAEAKKRLAAYLAAEEHSPTAANTVAWFCFRERAHLEWGKSVARAALQKAPENAALWDTLAELEGAQGNWQAALEAEKKAAAADPTEPYYAQQVLRFEAATARDG